MMADLGVVGRHVTKGKHRRRSTKLSKHGQRSESVPNFTMLYVPCPTMTPQISSFGTVPCKTKLNPIRTHGKYGALKTNSPKKLSLTDGFLRDQMYTIEKASGEPRNGI